MSQASADTMLCPRYAENKGYQVLIDSAMQMGARGLSPLRYSRLIALLGPELSAHEGLIDRICAMQHADGGWGDTEETIWCTKLLAQCASICDNEVAKGLGWLRLMQHKDGGWGLSSRDTSRIPTTGLLLTILPTLSNERAIAWTADTWRSDLASEVKLTYKGGFTLMALAAHKMTLTTEDLINETISYLAAEQNDDGGFGPWKNHPIGSDSWSTGITLVGLTSWPEKADRKVIERAVDWLCANQLESGLWPYHFIDEGSAYAYWGLTRAVDYLEKHGT